MDDDPPGVNSCAQDVADEDPEHLGDATPGGRRVDVPDDMAGKSGLGGVGGGCESGVSISADQGSENGDRLGRHLDLAKLGHGPKTLGDLSASGSLSSWGWKEVEVVAPAPAMGPISGRRKDKVPTW